MCVPGSLKVLRDFLPREDSPRRHNVDLAVYRKSVIIIFRNVPVSFQKRRFVSYLKKKKKRTTVILNLNIAVRIFGEKPYFNKN